MTMVIVVVVRRRRYLMHLDRLFVFNVLSKMQFKATSWRAWFANNKRSFNSVSQFKRFVLLLIFSAVVVSAFCYSL